MSPTTTAPSPAPAHVPDDVRASATTRLTDGAIDLATVLTTLKNAQGTSARHLLHAVRRLGPLRQSTLAEQVRTDPSTVSRHVAELVGDGLVERRADPDDGRASLLALTASGLRAVEEMRRARDARVATALDGWSTTQIDDLAEGLDRLAASLGSLIAP